MMRDANTAMGSSDTFSVAVTKDPLVVIVTRLGQEDEWRDWEFDENARIAFVNKGSPRVRLLSSLSGFNVKERIKNDDVWVINGKYFWRKSTFEMLGGIEWGEVGRRIIKHIHVGQNKSLKDPKQKRLKRRYLSKLSSKEEKENAKSFLESPSPFIYSLMGESLENRAGLNTVADFALIVRDKKGQNEYKNKVKALRLVGLRKRLSMLKHQLSHIFLPVKIDIEGWVESGFSREYAKEISEEYTKSSVKEIISNAKSVLYDKKIGYADDSIEEVAKDVLNMVDKKDEKEIIKKWEKVKGKFPKSGHDGEPIRTLNMIAELSGSKDSLDGNSFQEWFTDLEGSLDELRDTLPSS